MEVVVGIVAAVALGVSIASVFYSSTNDDNITICRADIDRIDALMRGREVADDDRRDRLKAVERRVSRTELQISSLGEDTRKPYSLFVTFKDFEHNKKIEGVVSHRILNKPEESSLTYLSRDLYVEPDYKEDELQAYKKGDKEGEPSAIIKLEDYVSIEIIKEDD